MKILFYLYEDQIIRRKTSKILFELSLHITTINIDDLDYVETQVFMKFWFLWTLFMKYRGNKYFPTPFIFSTLVDMVFMLFWAQLKNITDDRSFVLETVSKLFDFVSGNSTIKCARVILKLSTINNVSSIFWYCMNFAFFYWKKIWWDYQAKFMQYR